MEWMIRPSTRKFKTKFEESDGGDGAIEPVTRDDNCPPGSPVQVVQHVQQWMQSQGNWAPGMQKLSDLRKSFHVASISVGEFIIKGGDNGL